MNPSIAFIGNGKEIHGADEYDPLGKTVTPRPDGTTITRWHLIEAIENMHDADVDFICKMARKHEKTVMGQAICWGVLMEIVKKYWVDAEKQGSESIAELYDNFHL